MTENEMLLAELPRPTRTGRSPAWIGGLALAGFAGAAGLAAYAVLIEPMNVRLERLTLRLPGAGACLPRQGLRILHLSDSHFHGPERRWRERTKIERVRRLTEGLEYDLLVHTGDFIHYDDGTEHALGLLDAVPRPRLGSYGVFGNHDYTHYAMNEALPRMWRTFHQQEQAKDAQRNSLARAAARVTRWPRYVRYVRNTPLDGRRTGVNDIDGLAARLNEWGMEILHNRAVPLVDPASGLDLYLAGIDDVVEGRPLLGHTLSDVPEGKPLILLSHNPDVIASPQLPRVDVVLSGHTHGGQIVVPLWGPAHTQSEFISRRHVAGYFRAGRTHVYISRGLGEGIPLRFGATPQVTLIHVIGG